MRPEIRNHDEHSLVIPLESASADECYRSTRTHDIKREPPSNPGGIGGWYAGTDCKVVPAYLPVGAGRWVSFAS